MENIGKLKDEVLVRDYLSGDDSAFTLIVEKYLKPIYNFVYRMTKNKKDAEEITQESFIKIWKNLKKFKQTEKLKTWMFAIARNTAVDSLRKKKAVLFSEFDNENEEDVFENMLADDEMIADEIFEIAEKKDLVNKLLGNMPIKYRDVLLLYYKEELSFSEISKMLKKSINTVKSRHRRALLSLKEKLKNAPKL